MKKFTEKQKSILNAIVLAAQIIVVILAITLSAIVIANPRMDSAKVSGGPIKLLPVLSDSMDGDKKDSFKEGDMVVAGNPKNGGKDLEEGDIVTFKQITSGGKQILNTHRIYKREVLSDGTVRYLTKGDKEGAPIDPNWLYDKDVLAVYKYHLSGVGNVINWLQEPTHFLLIIVLPLVLLLAYNVYLFIRMLVRHRMGKLEENISKTQEDEIEKRVQELLAQKLNETGAATEEKTAQNQNEKE